MVVNSGFTDAVETVTTTGAHTNITCHLPNSVDDSKKHGDVLVWNIVGEYK